MTCQPPRYSPWRSYVRVQSRIQAGFTLVEVLIAVIVFSIGLLGLAAGLVSSLRSNHEAYYRSQATYVAQAVSEGLRSNRAGLQSGAYNTNFTSGDGGSGSCSNCSPTDLAQMDLGRWGRMAADRLPDGAVAIDCPDVDESSPGFYEGFCSIRVRWTQISTLGQQADPAPQIFTWMAQP